MARILLLASLLMASPVALAQSAVHHCASANGTPVFTDQPCDSAPSIRIGAIEPPSGHACPASRAALREHVAHAFVQHDANALAGLMLWDDYTDADAQQRLAQFKRWMRHPLLGVGDDGPTQAPVPAVAPSLATSAPRRPPPGAPAQPDLLVRIGGMQGSTGGTLRFAVTARAGCFWLHP